MCPVNPVPCKQPVIDLSRFLCRFLRRVTCLQELASVTSAHIKDKAHYESALSDVRDQARVRGVEAEDLRHQLATAKENLEAALRRVASVEQVLFHTARLSLLSWALGVTRAMCLERGDVLMQCARVVQSLSRALNAKSSYNALPFWSVSVHGLPAWFASGIQGLSRL
jgi:hypothetical protein